MSDKNSHTLDWVLQRLVLLRLFLPLVVVSAVAIGGAGYLGERTLGAQQHQTAQSMAQIVDLYLDQAARTLDSVARVAEVSLPDDLSTFMQATWEANDHFDTLYYLDASSKIELLTPADPRYLGLDMSNLPHFKPTEEEKNLVISLPFISLRTGNPTVYLFKQLSGGGQIVGELSLESLQDEVTRGKGTSQGVIFIMDQSGMLLAHPTSDLVKQRTNQSDLEIFHRGQGEDTTLIYKYDGTMVLGSATRIERAGWVVIAQVPVLVAIQSYVWALILSLLVSLIIWLALSWNLRNQLEQQVVIPLSRLGRGTGALANGDFSRGKALVSIPAAFAELTKLAADFEHMSDTLETRQVALQASEERYRSLFERMPVALFRSNPVGQFLDVNLAYVRLLGYPDRETLLKVNSLDLYANPKDRERWRAIAERDGIVWDFEMQLQQHDGVVIWVRNTCRAVRDSGGQVLYYEGSLEDITERKQVQEELKNAYKQLERSLMFNEALLSAIPTPVFYKDKEGRYLGCNHAFSEFTGVSSDLIKGKTVMELWPIENAEAYNEKDLELMSKAEQQIYEFRVRDKDGVDHPVIFAKNVFYDENKQIAGIVGAFLDITDSKRKEEALRESEARMRTLIDNLPIEFWAMDHTLCFTMQNSLSLKNLEPVVGKRIEDLDVPEALKALWVEEDLQVLEGKTLRKEYETDLEGKKKTYENIIAPVRVGESIVGLVGVAIDVTGRKHAEEEILRLNQELEQRVRDRTAQLEAANKELEAFAYSVSHDLRAPLRHIGGYLTLLQENIEPTLDKESLHFMTSITNSAKRMGALIDDLLSFSRMGRAEMFSSRVNIRSLIQDVISELEPELEDRKISWQIGDFPIVVGDRSLLKIVLNNLISNAVKFTSLREQAKIEVGVLKENQNEVVIYIRDNGVGFDMNYVDKLFGVFQRLHRQEDFQGTGIGLANVRRIINRHGGRTWAEGEVDHGATFYFSLPVINQEL
jgi:PAS domain S-box-containing protein